MVRSRNSRLLRKLVATAIITKTKLFVKRSKKSPPAAAEQISETSNAEISTTEQPGDGDGDIRSEMKNEVAQAIGELKSRVRVMEEHVVKELQTLFEGVVKEIGRQRSSKDIELSRQGDRIAQLQKAIERTQFQHGVLLNNILCREFDREKADRALRTQFESLRQELARGSCADSSNREL